MAETGRKKAPPGTFRIRAGRNISGVDGALEAAGDLQRMIDGILGKGATRKLSGCDRPGLAFSYHMLTEIAQGAVEACAQALEEAYA